MKLSVIIPCYNAEKYIGNCIYKILNEQIDNVNLKSEEIEIIVINDGSTDNSQKIIEDIAFKHTNVKLINKINEGVSVARNVGIEKANGKWIAFIDADDFIDERALPKLIEICETTGSDVIAFQYRHVNLQIKSTSQNSKPYITKSINGLSHIINSYGLTWSKGCWNNIYNLNFLRKNNLLFPKGIHYSEDFIFVLNVFCKAQNVHCVNNIFYNYVQTPDSCLHNISKKHLNKLNNGTVKLLEEFNLLNNIHPKLDEYINLYKHFYVTEHFLRAIIGSLGIKNIYNDLNKFKSMKLYPTTNYTKYPGYNSLNNKFIRIIINNRITLFIFYFYHKLINVFK